MTKRLKQLQETLREHLGDRIRSCTCLLGEVTLVVDVADYRDVMQMLKETPALSFEELIDLCGMDYAEYGNGAYEGPRYAVVVHLLSLAHNRRLRVRVFVPDENMPLVSTVTGIWPAANWFEREAFDLFGILFEGHPDLRRILTDYGFVGHPLRKDFPVHGFVEMRYDEEKRKVVYQPVTIEQREITPRVIREDDYGRR
ncbi:NADH-quinone oxidoreductase subunit C [Oxalobacter vibrioformis]|uniref:NADH-quinone oxidoreductase subunit C n=1 Tax=Oxalobacter vibrioformis TaxID=933080 RepID=A0A9E9LY40_9BURK|nr:NADH-quinone oxidoreductase subunit C [Oxalobacter vibrioformis]WAW10817.1 NADH-quinone oxidoreductase subunit C [Oxalobacter vibrioformis]